MMNIITFYLSPDAENTSRPQGSFDPNRSSATPANPTNANHPEPHRTGDQLQDEPDAVDVQTNNPDEDDSWRRAGGKAAD
ncbi:MAG TPA: hypothetical protein VF669_20085 [Tepidisphaeraceae bacterium]|jgi:hypothetical protein